jgi:acetolactate synthase-1/2/3 large subunit
VTGLAGAWLDSTPCLFISGQAKRSDLRGDSGVRQMGVQEVDIVAVVSPLTKYAVTVMEPTSIRYLLEKAVHLARTGRPGPVWIDIPLDVQAATIDPFALAPFELPLPPRPTDAPSFEDVVDRVVRFLNSAQRPILLVGNGVRLVVPRPNFTNLSRRSNFRHSRRGSRSTCSPTMIRTTSASPERLHPGVRTSPCRIRIFY